MYCIVEFISFNPEIGSIGRLPEIIAIKKKYGVYLYLDEAHSVVAMGVNGRGIIDYWGCNPRDVDALMGTFTKSFGSAGGYIAGSKVENRLLFTLSQDCCVQRLIDHIRATGQSGCYGASIPAPIAQQVISSMSIIMGRDGTSEGESIFCICSS